jgi:hypothetical protein
VRHLKRHGAGRIHEGWACYHSELLAFDLDGIGEAGIVGCAVGAPFSVLVAEQLFASGCRLLVSVTSAGQITAIGPTPYFVLIDHALRDEGTSYHYLSPSTFAEAPDAKLLARVEDRVRALPTIALHRGATWTTDAPYRETEAAISRARDLGALAVEMEAAALYAFSAATGHQVVCFAHVTNAMAQTGGFRKRGGRWCEGNACGRHRRLSRLVGHAEVNSCPEQHQAKSALFGPARPGVSCSSNRKNRLLRPGFEPTRRPF